MTCSLRERYPIGGKGCGTHFPQPSKSAAMVTLRHVAKECGLSPATVSIVLNNAPLARYIPTETKERILKAAKKLRYRPNLYARSLVSKRSHAIGVMVCDMTDPFCTLILRGVENSLYHGSYLPILTDFHNEQARFERHLEMLLDRRVEGLIVLANWLFADINMLADVLKRSLPTAMIGRDLHADSMSSVTVDNEAGACIGLEHLYKLGHRKIAFIRGPKAVADSAQRWKGIRSFAQRVDLQLDGNLIVDLPGSLDPLSGFEGGYLLTKELLSRKRSFTALMAFDDMTALGVIRALVHAGFRVPERCSVIGFDDIPSAALYSPSLTTLRQPMEAMGSIAASVVMEGISASLEKKQLPPAQQKVLPELVLRESTRAL